ncbi:AI-2E family transporter YdiK [Mycetohabitans sp. B5]|uniref:Putative PurR-regulated permease PerM n=1 Tax=Mycetohabitans endofungorum TaxID=417203 RepID=A0A2P5KCR4_9BURK|nr:MULTISPECIES: AI-2E family transporter YdiK [Mycetohabitans]MCG1055637.1 AI-2E family transporter YdiK [Mycetohabitans sp. B5]PPB84500.1 putative PurR-regulated permease PerM [Mycetohabitans endofungorum]
MNHSQAQTDIARALLIIFILSLLIGGSLYIMSPFLPALIWATMIVVATWPMMRGAQERLGGRRGRATALMLAGLLIVIALPLYGAVVAIAAHADTILQHARALPNYRPAPPPAWLHEVPLVGERITSAWQRLTHAGVDGLLEFVAPYADTGAKWMVSRATAVGGVLVHLLLTLILCGVLYMHGEAAAGAVRRFAYRLADERGTAAVRLAGQAIRAVALGIVVTAAVQSALAGLGLLAAGIPGAGMVCAITLIFCLAQIGPLLPLIGAAIWLFYQDATIAGVAMLIWAFVVSSLDNVIRPPLIQRGVDLPMLLVLAGVLGGLFAFGIVGLFIGPVILAVTYKLMHAWIDEQAKAVSRPTRQERA